MTLTLTPELTQIIERLIAGGSYASPDDVLRKVLQGLEQSAPAALAFPPRRHSMLEILQETPPPQVFKSAAEADAFLRAERDAWDK